MPIKRKPVRSQTDGGGEKPPLSTSGKGGIKKRTILPPAAPMHIDIGGELGQIINAVNKEAGPGAPFIQGSQKRFHAGFARTGILSMDLALGGGWRRSSGGMLYGEKSAGKTTIALKTVANLQRDYPNQNAVWVDIEGTLDLSWAKKLNVDLDRFVIAEPDSGEDAVNQADAVTRASNVSIVVVDSIAMLSPMKEIEGAAEDEMPGHQARLVTKFLRKVNNALLRERKRGHFPLVLHLNQFRMKIMAFGDPRTLPGGKALEFSTTQQAEVKNKEHLSTKGDEKGYVMFNEHTINITKNKSGGPLKEAQFKFIRTPHDDMPEAWVDQASTICSLGLKSGVLHGVPQAFSHDSFGKWRGGADYTKWALENLIEHDQIQAEIVAYYTKKWKLV